MTHQLSTFTLIPSLIERVYLSRLPRPVHYEEGLTIWTTRPAHLPHLQLTLTPPTSTPHHPPTHTPHSFPKTTPPTLTFSPPTTQLTLSATFLHPSHYILPPLPCTSTFPHTSTPPPTPPPSHTPPHLPPYTSTPTTHLHPYHTPPPLPHPTTTHLHLSHTPPPLPPYTSTPSES